MLAKKIIVDAATGEETVVEEDMVLPPTLPTPTINVDLNEVAKVVAKAKSLGWL